MMLQELAQLKYDTSILNLTLSESASCIINMIHSLAWRYFRVEQLPPLEHGIIDYEPFNKEFYEEHKEVSGLSHEDAEAKKKAMAIRTSGFDVPRQISTFEHVCVKLHAQSAQVARTAN